MFKKLAVIGGAIMILVAGVASAADWSVVEADLKFMREEEKLARDVYATLYEHHLAQGLTLTVCDNIAYSEQRHMDAMKQLLDTYGLPDAAVDEGQGIYPDSCRDTGCGFNNTDLASLFTGLVSDGKDSGLAALLVGGLIEEVEMIDLAEAFASAERYLDIQAVYDNLLCGSRNHLRAFAHNTELATGQSYLEASAAYVALFGIRPAEPEEYLAYVESINPSWRRRWSIAQDGLGPLGNGPDGPRGDGDALPRRPLGAVKAPCLAP